MAVSKQALDVIPHDLFTDAIVYFNQITSKTSPAITELAKQKLTAVINYQSTTFGNFDHESQGYIICARNAYTQILFYFQHKIGEALIFSRQTIHLLKEEFKDNDTMAPLLHYRLLIKTGNDLEAKEFGQKEVNEGNKLMSSHMKRSKQFK